MRYDEGSTIGFTSERSNGGFKDYLFEANRKADSFKDTDPDLAMMQIARINDIIVRKVYTVEIGTDRELTTEHVLFELRRREVVPKFILVHLNVVHILSERISWEQETDNQLPLYVEAALKSLKKVIDWVTADEKKQPALFDPFFEIGEDMLDWEDPPGQSDNEINAFKHDKLGTSRFAREEELAPFKGDDGLVLSKYLRLSKEKSYEHSLCLGPTGSGKSTCFFIPNLLTLPDSSIIVSDPKGELFEKTAATNIAQGKRVIVFNPYDENTMRYNPLALCHTISEIRELAQVLMTNGVKSLEVMNGGRSKGGDQLEWQMYSVPLLTAALIRAKGNEAPKNTVYEALRMIVENDPESMDDIFNDAKNDWELAALEQYLFFKHSTGSERTSSSILMVLSASIQIFSDPLIKRATSRNEIDPSIFRKSPTVLYVTIPEHKSAAMAPLTAPFFIQMMEHLIETPMNVPVYFLLDEFANIGMIPNIERALATFRSREISISVGLQSINQLTLMYGHEKAHAILDNIKTKFVLPGLSYESASYFSKLFGHKEIDTYSRSVQASHVDMGLNVSKARRELLSLEEIRTMPSEKMIAVIDNLYPFVDDQVRYYNDVELLQMTRKKIDIETYMRRQKEGLT